MLKRLGGIQKDYPSPIINGATEAFQGLVGKFNEATDGGEGVFGALESLMGQAESVAPVLGEFLGDNIRRLGEVIGGAIWFAGKLADGIKWIGEKAEFAWGEIKDFKDMLGKIDDSKLGKILSLGGAGFLGLFREDQSWAGTGLGRAQGGITFVGGGTYNYGPRQVVVPMILEGQEISRHVVPIARAQGRQEVSKQLLQAGRS